MNLLTLSKVIDNEELNGTDDGYSIAHIFAMNELYKKELTLGMFVPCKDSEPLKKPQYYDIYDIWDKEDNTLSSNKIIQALIDYQVAEKLVIFEGFGIELEDNGSYIINNGVTELAFIKLIDGFAVRYSSNAHLGQSRLFIISDLAEATQETQIELVCKQ